MTMQIDFASSGGIANRELEYRVDSSTLSEVLAGELEMLVETSGVFDLREKDVNPSITVGRADVITYLSFAQRNGNMLQGE